MTNPHTTSPHITAASLAVVQPRHDTDEHTNAPGRFDALLNELVLARQRRDQADQEIRTLIALGREFTAPRPYRLTDLAHAAGMSPSGARTAYGLREIAYLRLILTCNGKVPGFLMAPITALRHQPTPEHGSGA